MNINLEFELIRNNDEMSYAIMRKGLPVGRIIINDETYKEIEMNKINIEGETSP
jgi:hypothetical protein